jgi:hypothetical protein
MRIKIWKNQKQVWEYGNMGVWKYFFKIILFVNSSLKPFIHGYFRRRENFIYILPYSHTPILG